METKKLSRAKFLILDIDGTVCLGENPLPGAVDFVNSIQDLGLDFCFFTNNSSKSVVQCVEKLQKTGISLSEKEVATSTQVMIEFLKKEHHGKKIFLLGNDLMRAEFAAVGLDCSEDAPDCVVLGFDTTLNYGKISHAAQWIAKELPYFATHPDINCPVLDGFIPDVGAMIELFAASTGRRPLVTGKPTVYTVDYLTKRLGCKRNELVFIGDRLETDIAIARHGATAILVLTGVTNRADYQAQTEIRADFVVENLSEARKLFQQI